MLGKNMKCKHNKKCKLCDYDSWSITEAIEVIKSDKLIVSDVSEEWNLPKTTNNDS